jgi:outer membrane biosynthesis protein TonB
MRLSLTLCLLALLASARSAAAQTCTPPEHPFFELQLARPAQFIGDTTSRPRPTLGRRGSVDDAGAFLVSFVVDTLGMPDEKSLKVIRSPSSVANDSVRVALRSWRFKPAVLGGCRVPQLMQTMVER